MYIVAIGWAYVILMMALTASSVGKALVVLLFLGALPLALFVYIADRPRRRSAALDEVANQRDTSHTQSDQN